jgi:hypothetical protein
MTKAVDNWVKDVEFDGFWSKAVLLDLHSARNLVMRNYMHDTFIDGGFTSYPVHLMRASSDNHIHMNYCTQGSKCVVIQMGAIGNVITYNYGKYCDTHKRLIFFHGEYPSENLVEANELDTDCNIDYDNWYGIQGPRNTFFRNRVVDHTINDVKPVSIRSHKDKDDDQIAELPNLILNFAPAFYQSRGCKSTDNLPNPGDRNAYHDGRCESWDWDGQNYADSGNLYVSPWAERNIGTDTRSVDDCTADQTPYSCCNGFKSGNCDFGAAFSTNFVVGNVENYNRADPHPGWAGDSYPYSLVNGWNDAGFRPPGWCQEITDWPLMGADVDSLPTANLQKSPAHRLFDGDTCTPVDFVEECNSTNPCPDDGLWCNGNETCQSGTCVSDFPGSSRCEDSHSCTTITCNEETDSCNPPTYNNALCDDSNLCTTDNCTLSGCSYSYNTNTCDDGEVCTENDVCSGGSCTGTPITQCSMSSDSCCPGNCDDSNDIDCASGLLLHLKFDDDPSDGTATDSSVNGNHGTCTSCPALTNDKDDNPNSAYLFDGTNYIDLGNLDINSNGLTIMAWINANSFIPTAGDNRVVSKSTGTMANDHYWMLSTYNNNGIKLRFRLKTDASPDTETLIAGSGDIYIGEWTHVAATYNGSHMKLYKNSVEVGSLSKTGSIATNPSVNAEVGRNPNGYGEFDGIIDDVRIYTTALSREDIQNIITGTTSTCNTGADKPPCDGCVDGGEILVYIDRWYASSQDVSMVQLVRALEAWKEPCV